MLRMINEKTGIYLDTRLSFFGTTYYMGAIFEPKIDFAKNTCTRSVKMFRLYRRINDRFVRVKGDEASVILCLIVMLYRWGSIPPKSFPFRE